MAILITHSVQYAFLHSGNGVRYITVIIDHRFAFGCLFMMVVSYGVAELHTMGDGNRITFFLSLYAVSSGMPFQQL